jgi:hypothetical protein
MPRALILDYLLTRCTKDNPNFFDCVKFNTSVNSVSYNDDKRKFVIQIQTIDPKSELVTEAEELFDKCIWAAGDNGKPSIPQRIADILSPSSGGFKGTVIHSCAAGSDFDKLVIGKKVLLIGDNYSAEDLTLSAIKLGVKSVDILSRSGEGAACDTASWPRNCVEIHEEYGIIGVSDDGWGVVIENEEEEDELTLNDIDTIIYCTGYVSNTAMLNPSLSGPVEVEGPFFSDYEELGKHKMDWKMTSNHLSKDLGDVPIGAITDYYMTMPNLYRGHLISNTNMMFFRGERLDSPLLDLDVQAWLLLAHITGDLALPSVKEMKRFNLQALMDELQDPYIRLEIDANYGERYDEIIDQDEQHWIQEFGDKRSREMEKNNLDLQYRTVARDMVDAKYPLNIGTHKKLNEKGKALVEFDAIASFDAHEIDLVEGSKDSSWKTFRDCDTTKIYSIMTGTKAVPLKCHWLDLQGDGIEDICGHADDIIGTKKSALRSENSKATFMKKMGKAIRMPFVK